MKKNAGNICSLDLLLRMVEIWLNLVNGCFWVMVIYVI